MGTKLELDERSLFPVLLNIVTVVHNNLFNFFLYSRENVLLLHFGVFPLSKTSAVPAENYCQEANHQCYRCFPGHLRDETFPELKTYIKK
uniref:Uncharacterized protein n=1 Tax=Oryctolagus cuniculus TaxID=9986 RepID=A0A5F9CAC7_RABIT